METTPPRSKLSCKTIFKAGVKVENNSSGSSTSSYIGKTNSKVEPDNDYSPLYLPSTQESNEDIDVLWDWHSPQTSERRRKKQKRLITSHSPNVPIKRHPSHNNNTNFDKLRNELKLLQEELAMPDDESCLCISPQQEVDFKSSDEGDNHLHFAKEEDQCNNFDDLFNDSADEQLVLFSQQIESELFKKEQGNQLETKKDDSIFACDNTEIDILINKYSNKGCDKFKNGVNEEKCDSVLSSFHKEAIAKPSASTRINKFSLQRTRSDDNGNNSIRKVVQTMSGKLELHRTKSFELEANKHVQVPLTKSQLEEIERNKAEAMAKLALKKKREINTQTTQLSPSKCSPEEIEKKRLQALAKREARRLEEIVERKRQEALKRLQANRMKNANVVKSTLATRL